MDFTGDPVVKNPLGNAGHSKTKPKNNWLAGFSLWATVLPNLGSNYVSEREPERHLTSLLHLWDEETDSGRRNNFPKRY